MNNRLAQFKTALTLGFLNHGLITILKNGQKAFKWAMGWRTPLYADNREGLSIVLLRNMVIEYFLEYIRENDLKWDCLWATVTAGIPWAAILAYELEIPLYFYNEKTGKLYCFKNLHEEILPFEKTVADAEIIASNTPWGIVYGAAIAHKTQKPFLYVRDEKKPHGKMNQIEGRFEKGQSVGYIHIAPHFADNQRYESNLNILVDEGLVEMGSRFSTDDHELIFEPDQKPLTGLNAAIVEDLISTAGSSIGKEAANCRSLGGIVKDMLAVFHYKMKRAAVEAEKAQITIHHILDFPSLLEEGVTNGLIDDAQHETLDNWYANPEGWSEEYLLAHAEEA